MQYLDDIKNLVDTNDIGYHFHGATKDEPMTFDTIGILSRSLEDKTTETYEILLNYLLSQSKSLLVEQEAAQQLGLTHNSITCLDRDTIAKNSDLIIVIGGDGSLLQAAKHIVPHQTPIIGINRGRLGFLADIKPEHIEHDLSKILQDQYVLEKRFLIEAATTHGVNAFCSALNDIVLASGDTAHMISFDIYVDDHFMTREHADGLIVATPTGSTAYALSGGGPIVHPKLDALLLVPMFPHNLSSRPFVINGNSHVHIIIGDKSYNTPPKLHVDGKKVKELHKGDGLVVRKRCDKLKLLHPQDYDYYKNLRSKMHWGNHH